MFKKKQQDNSNDGDVINLDDDKSTADMVSNNPDMLDDSVVAEGSMGEMIKNLREKLKRLEGEKQEYLTGWQRAKADLINARKRDEEDRKEAVKYASEAVIADIIPVLDSFTMAMGNKEAWEKADKNWRMGVEYIYSQLIKALSENGLKELNPIGETYDHNKHEAISHEDVADEKQHDKIIQVVQKGYELNGKLLKVPKVKVGEWKK